MGERKGGREALNLLSGLIKRANQIYINRSIGIMPVGRFFLAPESAFNSLCGAEHFLGR